MKCTCSILSSVTCLDLQHFPTLSYIGHHFRGGVIAYKMCVLIFSATLSEIFLI